MKYLKRFNENGHDWRLNAFPGATDKEIEEEIAKIDAGRKKSAKAEDSELTEEEPAKSKDMTDEERKQKDDDYYRSTGHATGDWGPSGDVDYGMVKVEDDEEEKPTLGYKIKSFLGFKK